MLIDRFIDFITSLRLTVVCLAMAMVLVFVGTLAQVKLGLYLAQEQYFQSFFVPWTIPGSSWRIPVWPGGYLLGGLLVVNLIAAHLKRFGLSRKKIGIVLIHGGLILLFVGQFATDLFSRESHMRLEEGQTKNYSESDRQSELVVIDATDPATERVVAFDEYLLSKNQEITRPELPFRLVVKQYFQNSTVRNRAKDSTAPPVADQGMGLRLDVSAAPVTVKMNERNIPSAVVEVVSPQGSLGTWLVSSYLEDGQSFAYQDRTYRIAMRWARFYKDHALQLLDFSHDRYKGTELPKNFSSRVRLTHPKTGEDREVLIYMNSPLRYAGETYYQASFEPGDKVSILQVVRNPSWLTPYFSCTLVGAGLLVQFLSHLTKFAKRKNA